MNKKLNKFCINSKISLSRALKDLSLSGNKTLFVINKKKQLIGTFSDGDARKAINNRSPLNITIDNLYNKKPTSFYEDKYDEKLILKAFKSQNYDCIPIINFNKEIVKIIKWSDLLEKKVKKVKIKKQKVVIMAGGLGTRMQPFTDILPKPLIPINNKPIIEHIINSFKKDGFNKFIISINYKAGIIKNFFENTKYKKSITYLEEKIPMGTIGSIFKLKKKLKNDFFVCNCDILLDINFLELLNIHKKNKNDLTLVVVNKQYQIPYGTCSFDENGGLIKLNEKPSYDLLINTGCYVFSHNIFKLLSGSSRLDINILINKALKKGFKIGSFVIKPNSWKDIGEWNEYKKVINIFEN